MYNKLPSLEYLEECFHYHVNEGKIVWKIRPDYHFTDRKTHALFTIKCVGEIAGSSDKDGYRRVKIDGLTYGVHRIIWKMHTGIDPLDKKIDHINGKPWDNRFVNFRLVDHQENMRNQKMFKSNISGVTGVGWVKSLEKWRVRINDMQGETIYLGVFDDFDEAIMERWEAEIEYGYHENHGVRNDSNWKEYL